MNTTLVLIATDADLSKPQLTKIAQMAHDGLARAIPPIHTMLDGDSAYAVSVGLDGRRKRLDLPPLEAVDRVGAVAADLSVRAIIKSLEAARSIPGYPSYRDWLYQKEGRKK